MSYEIPQLNYLAEKGCSLVRDFCYKPQAAQALKVDIQALRTKYKNEKGLSKVPDGERRNHMLAFLESIAREVDKLSSTSEEGLRGRWSRLWGASAAEEKTVKLEREKALILTGALIFIRNLMVDEYRNAWGFKDPRAATTFRLVNALLDPSEKSFICDPLPEPYLFSKNRYDLSDGERYIDYTAHLGALQALQAFLPKITESKTFQELQVSTCLADQIKALSEQGQTQAQKKIMQMLEKQQRIVGNIQGVFEQATLKIDDCIEDTDNMRFAINASGNTTMVKQMLLEATALFEKDYDPARHDAKSYFKGCLDMAAGAAIVASLMLLRLKYQDSAELADKHCQAVINHALKNTTANQLDLSCQQTAQEVVSAMELYGRLVNASEDKSLYQAPWDNASMTLVIDEALKELVGSKLAVVL